VKLTKTSVEAIAIGAKDTYAWDDRIPGFGCKTTPTGRRVYILKYRFAGQQRWLVLGRHGDLTCEQARQKAIQGRGELAHGRDPAGSRDVASPTVDELADKYLDEHARPHKRPRSIAEDERNLRKHVRPVLGKLRVDTVTKQDILRLRHGLRDHPIAANRVTALLSTMFELAVDWGMRPVGANPVKGVKRFPEVERERFLSRTELDALYMALETAEAAGEHPHGTNAIRLLMLTGCRRNEILSLEWAHIDFAESCLRLPTSKTGRKTVRLGAAALALLDGLPRAGRFVFPAAEHHRVHGRRPGPGHYTGIERAWQRIRASAGLADVRLHDLRHSFASHAVMAGMSLPMIGKLLGHRRTSTTQRYAHFADDAVQIAAEQATALVQPGTSK
jgi:integrase